MSDIRNLLKQNPIVPVVTMLDAADAVPLAEALMAGGIRVIEVTLRNAHGLGAITAIRKSVPDMLMGAGTVTTAELLAQARDAGAQFHVSPGLTESLADAANKLAQPLLPGIATPSEAMQAQEWGFTTLKFFPASCFGGIDTLKHIGSVLPQLAFCPTGGVNLKNLKDFLSLPNVAAIGGSWLTPANAMEAKNWGEITRLAAEATAAR